MEKKKCPQCKNLILKTSPTCLYCGRPNKFITKDYVNKKWNKDNYKNRSRYCNSDFFDRGHSKCNSKHFKPTINFSLY